MLLVEGRRRGPGAGVRGTPGLAGLSPFRRPSAWSLGSCGGGAARLWPPSGRLCGGTLRVGGEVSASPPGGGVCMLWRQGVVRRGMPGWRPRVAGYSVGSPVGHRVAVVAACLGRVDGEGCCVGRLWHLLRCSRGVPSSGSGCSWMRRGVRLSSCVSGGCNWAKALCFGADDDGARGCRSPLEDAVAGLLPLSVFQVKTLVRFVGRGDGDALRRFPS